MNVLIVDRNPDLCDLVKSYIENLTQEETHFSNVTTRADAIEILNQKRFDLIITEYTLEKGTAKDIYEFCQDYQKDIKFILTTGRDYSELDGFQTFLEDSENNYFMRKPFDLNVLNASIISSLKFNSKKQGYWGVNKPLFKKYANFNHDLYLKLSETKYIKFLVPNENNNTDDLDKLFSKKIDIVYFKEKDYREYINEILIIVSAEPSFNHIEAMSEILKNFPLNEAVKASIDANINELTKELDKSLDKEYLNEILNEESFLYKHSLLIAYTTSYIISKFEWGNNSNMLDKVTRASFLHDIFSEDGHEKEHFHITKAVNLVKDIYPDNDLIKLVEQHHENPDGSGFPRRLTSRQIQPLSACFIIAHHMAETILSQRNLSDWYIKGATYYTHSFTKPYNHIKDLVKKLS